MDVVTTKYTLWGWTAQWGPFTPPAPIRITGGSLRDCRVRDRQFRSDYPDALSGIYESGDDPKGLALQIQQRVEGS